MCSQTGDLWRGRSERERERERHEVVWLYTQSSTYTWCFFLSLHLSNGALCRVDLHLAEALGESACVKVRDVR